MNVLIAVDSSEHAEKAYDWYVKSLHKPDNTVFLLHVKDVPKLPTFSFTEAGAFPAEEITKIMTKHNEDVNKLENTYTVKLGQKKIKNKILLESSGGSPGQCIVDKAKENKVDLIIMGSRGLGTVRRTILGSVSDYVVHHTKIPILICPK
uniref:universal stress protein YxiE-like n=1 Tax=Styela clava TaxID=7725 RepID=UPI00193AB789|nr:universal stress protein YxiE-like [Styela clava]